MQLPKGHVIAIHGQKITGPIGGHLGLTNICQKQIKPLLYSVICWTFSNRSPFEFALGRHTISVLKTSFNNTFGVFSRTTTACASQTILVLRKQQLLLHDARAGAIRTCAVGVCGYYFSTYFFGSHFTPMFLTIVGLPTICL